VRRKRQAPETFDRTIDANQIVGANFRMARELRGWTQEETARVLAPYLGQTLPKASISAIERGLDRDRRRVFNAQELVAFSLAFDVPIWWFFLPLIGSDTMRLENTGERASNLLMLLLGRQDQVQLLRDRVATLRKTSDRTAVEEMLERFVGAKSWQHLEATRLLAIQELAYREASTIESLIGSLREVVAKFDGVFEEVVPRHVEMAAFMEWKPSQVYRKTSEVLLGKALFHNAFDDENDFRRHRLDLLLSREDLPLEDWIDTEDKELLSRVAAVFDRIEEQLRDKELPPPPDRVPDPE
jgi:transcriptional regulator with XRE-family HTH domain